MVGFSYTTGHAAQHAFFYNGVMNDLNDLIPAGSGWELVTAFGINDAGQIAGTGVINASGTLFC